MTMTMTRRRRIEAAEIARDLANKGKTIKQISAKLHTMGYSGRKTGTALSYNTLHKWLNHYEEITGDTAEPANETEPVFQPRQSASSGHDAKKAALIDAVAHLDIEPALRLSMLESILSI